ILLPLYPHFSVATTGSGFKEWDRVAKQKSMNGIEVKRIKEYFDHPLYIEALIDRIQIALRRVPDKDRKRVHLVFSAHGTPMKLVHNGDPYSHQIRKTYDLVVQGGNFGLPHTLCFQSKVGPQKWLEPSLTGTIEELARQKVSHVVVIPIAFVTDHIETLSEINIEVKAEA
ncbi:MAG: ferrochelatase, partial [Bacteroidetes bacterium]|nr:ferrochelatase [Bacteroidota bacterium]